MKRLMAVGLATLAAWSVGAATRTDDGRGLVDALAGSSLTEARAALVAPFRYLASAVTGGQSATDGGTIDLTGENAWAAQELYQLERYGKTMTVTFSHLVPGASYLVELHSAENYFGSGGRGGNDAGANTRVAKVAVNDGVVEERLDLWAAAGNKSRKAVCRQYAATATAAGTIVVTMTTVADNAQFGGMAVFGSAAPSTPALATSRASDSSDLVFSWGACTDTLRFHLQKATSAEGPWTTVGVYVPGTTGATLAGAYSPTETVHYRVVASNGVGVATSAVVTYASALTDGTAIKTRGETLANGAATTYRMTEAGAAADPVNALAADAVTVNGLYLDAGVDSELAVGEGQTFAASLLGVGDAGGTFALTGAGALAFTSGHLLTLDVRAGALNVATSAADAEGKGALLKNGAGRAAFTGGLTGVKTATVNAGTLAVATAQEDETFATVLVGAGTFEKTGAGRMTLVSTNTAFTGDVRVSEGTLRLGMMPTPLPAMGTMTIASGAALDVGVPAATNQGVKLGARKVVVSGSGPDGKGAIVNATENSQFNALQSAELAGDVTFGGGIEGTTSGSKGRWDLRTGEDATKATFTMNGHNVEKVGGNMVCLTSVNVTEGGPVRIDVKEGYWSSEASTTYAGGSENLFDVYEGAVLDFYKMTQPITWAINLREGATLRFRSGSSSQNRITGPVTLAGGTVDVKAEVDDWSQTYGTLAGKVTGAGRLRSVCGSGCRVSLLNDANDYTGGTWVQGGDLYAASKGALPGYDDAARLVVTNGTLILPYGTGAWAESDVAALMGVGALRVRGSYLGLEVPDTVEAAFTEAHALPRGGFSKYGKGRLTVTQPLTLADGQLSVYNGELRVDGTTVTEVQNNVHVRGTSALVLTNNAALYVQMTNNGYNVSVGASQSRGELAELKVCAGATLAVDQDCTINKSTSALRVGCSDGGKALLTIEPGATVRHRILVSSGSWTQQSEVQGAVIQNGGHVENQGGAANDIRIGDYGYGYYELNGGDLEWWGYGTLGGDASSKARGVMAQHGGTFRYVGKASSGRFGFSRGGSGSYYNDGGTFEILGSGGFLAMGETDNTNSLPTESSFTLDGANAKAFLSPNQTHWFCNRPYHTATINVNDGALLSSGPLSSRGSYDSASTWHLLPAMKAYLNFDGGVFQAPKSMTLFSGSTNKMPTAVTVYAGGVTFDVTNADHVLTVNQPLRAPTGKGIGAIAAPKALLDKAGYIGAPYVTISGGDGFGASAVALYDSKTRRVTGIKVTSPGSGYTAAPKVTVSGGGYTNVYACTVTLAENAKTGGLTKTGPGRVNLTAANTFGGTVTVEEGTLAFMAEGSCPTGAAVVVKGGTLLAATPLPCRSFTGTGAATLVGNKPGLWFGMLSGNANWTGENPMTATVLDFAKVNSQAGWSSDVTAVYTGYVWNNTGADAKWTFIEHFDDRVRLWIDGTLVLSDDGWSTPSKATVTVAPGAHRIEARFGQGTGGAGPSTSDGTTGSLTVKANTLGFYVDWQGRNSDNVSDYEAPVDPGDGSRFTQLANASNAGLLASDTALTVAAGSSLAMGAAVQTVADLAGVGAVTCGALKPTGTWTVDLAAALAGSHLTVTGAIDLSAVTEIACVNAESLPSGGRIYVIAEATSGFTGDLAALLTRLTGLPQGNWKLDFGRDGTQLRLYRPNATTIILR